MRRLGMVLAWTFLPWFLLLTQPASAWWMYTPGDTVDNARWLMLEGYKPEQPIAFSHKLHAGDRQIPCQYCHSSARRSITSGIPSLNTCMGCHRLVATDKPAIQKLTEHYKNNDPIKWVKVHDLPDFVRFSHKIHVSGAKLECQECHGPVETMEVVEQHAPLQMGWCVECHRDRGAKLDCLTCHY